MSKKIIPCLDIQKGRVVKGTNFQNMLDVADPVTLALKYEKEGADTLFLLNIDGNDQLTFLQIVREIRCKTNIPLYVGGGVRTVEDIAKLLHAGATKVSITSAAIVEPSIMNEASYAFGKDKIILSIDAKQISDNKWHAYIHGGKEDTKLDVVDWAVEGEKRGASEILLNSIDVDGVKKGYDIALNKAVANAVTIPVIASGGAGSIKDFTNLFTKTDVQAALAASIFHYDEIKLHDIKETITTNER